MIEQAASSPSDPPRAGGANQSVDTDGGGESGGVSGGTPPTAMSAALLGAMKA